MFLWAHTHIYTHYVCVCLSVCGISTHFKECGRNEKEQGEFGTVPFKRYFDLCRCLWVHRLTRLCQDNTLRQEHSFSLRTHRNSIRRDSLLDFKEEVSCRSWTLTRPLVTDGEPWNAESTGKDGGLPSRLPPRGPVLSPPSLGPPLLSGPTGRVRLRHLWLPVSHPTDYNAWQKTERHTSTNCLSF